MQIIADSIAFCVRLLVATTSILTAIALFSCGNGSNDSRFTAVEGMIVADDVSLRVYKADGTALKRPYESFSLSVTKMSAGKVVSVSANAPILTGATFLEIYFNGNKYYPVDITNNILSSNSRLLTYNGCPMSGMIISAQVQVGVKTTPFSGEILSFTLHPGRHLVKEVSGFSQNPDTDNIVASLKVDDTNKNKIYWRHNLRGEANANQLYDFADFGVVGAKYNQKVASKPEVEVVDGSVNGVVDFADFGIIGANYNQGIGGVKILRDDSESPTTELGTLGTDGKYKGTLVLEALATSVGKAGFKEYWFECEGSGRYIKLILLNHKGAELSKYNTVVDTGVTGELGSRGDWWMFGREPAHNQLSPFYGPATNALKWQFKASHWIQSTPVIDSEDNLYFGVMDLNSGGTDSYLYSVDKSGKENWKYLAPNWIGAAPAIAEDGTIYFGCTDGYLYALYRNNVLRWKFKAGDSIRSSPAIAADGTVYFGCNDKNLYAVNPDGTQKWLYTTGDIIASNPAISADGTVLIGCNDTYLYAINPDGSKKWTYKTENIVFSAPSVAADGTIYVGSMDNKLYAINPDGTYKWSFSTGGGVTSSPAIAADGTVYIGSWDNNIYAINPDGSQKWFYTTADFVTASASVCADGTIYIGSRDKKIYALSPNGSLVWSYETAGWVNSAPSFGSDGTVYFGSVDTNLYAFGPGSPPQKPAAPENVQASDDLDVDLIDISWSAPTSGIKPDSYKVYRSKTETGTYSLIASLGDVLSYTDDTVPDTDVYWYRITAIKSGVESDPSDADEGKKHLPGPGDWAMFGREPTQNRRSPFIGPSTNTVKWSVQMPKTQANQQPRFIGTSPALGADGSVYIGAEYGNLYSIRANGVIKWATSLERSIEYSSPAIATDGIIYNGSDAHKLFALSSKAVKWTVIGSSSNTADAWIKPSPIIGGDGTVYYGDRVGKFYAVNAEGKEQWRFDAYSEIYSSAAISAEGTIYFGDSNAHFFALNPDGLKKWEYDMPGTMMTSPAIASDGTVYTASSNGKLIAFNPDSSIKWEFPAAGNIGSIWGSPAIASDGTVYIGNDDKKLYAINPDGTKKWEFLTGDKIGSRAPAIDAKGNIYFCSWDKKIYAVSAEGKEVWSFEASKYSDGSPAIGEDGTIYYGGWDGVLYAIGPGAGKSGLLAPINVAATDGTDKDKIVVSWQAPVSGPTPDGYYIYHALSSAGVWQYLGKSATTSFNDTIASSGKTYYYRVQSYKYVDDYNDSGYSNQDQGSR